MIEITPDFVDSEYFIAEPDWRLKKDAPERLKAEFEKYQNREKLSKLYKREFPDMVNPYYEWTGKIVDRG